MPTCPERKGSISTTLKQQIFLLSVFIQSLVRFAANHAPADQPLERARLAARQRPAVRIDDARVSVTNPPHPPSPPAATGCAAADSRSECVRRPAPSAAYAAPPEGPSASCSAGTNCQNRWPDTCASRWCPPCRRCSARRKATPSGVACSAQPASPGRSSPLPSGDARDGGGGRTVFRSGCFALMGPRQRHPCCRPRATQHSRRAPMLITSQQSVAEREQRLSTT